MIREFLKYLQSRSYVKKDAKREESRLEQYWKEYTDSLLEKGRLIETLQEGPGLKGQIQQLQQSIAHELVDTAEEEQSDEELVADLKRITQKTPEDPQLSPFEKADRYFQKLFDILTNQLHTLSTLNQNETDLPKSHLIQQLQATWAAERELVEHIQELEKEEGKLIHEIIT